MKGAENHLVLRVVIFMFEYAHASMWDLMRA